MRATSKLFRTHLRKLARYNVGLTVTDSGGQIGSDIMEITVEEAPEEEEEDNNNSGSDDSIDVDDIIDDLFDRLGIR